MIKKIFLLLTLFAAFQIYTPSFAQASLNDWDDNLKQAKGDVYTDSGGSTISRVTDYVGKILLIVPFLGMILMIRIVWAGYLWMTAGGNATQVEEAKKTMTHSSVGVIVLVAAYLIAYFIIYQISKVTGYNANL